MSCSACGGGGSLARCGCCRWPRYCSKDCQRAHWSTRHRHECALLLSCATFRDLERRFWGDSSRRNAPELRSAGLDPDSMRFYGEVLFLALGLKACVVLSNLPPSWRANFIADVVMPSGMLSASSPQCTPRGFVVGARVETPAEYALSGDLVLANEAHPAFRAAEHALHLRKLTADASRGLEQALELKVDRVHVVEEQTLALVLDYPVALSDCREPMVEVGYFLVSSGANKTEELLASYCTSAADTEQAALARAHFERYRSQLLARAGVALVVHQAVV